MKAPNCETFIVIFSILIYIFSSTIMFSEKGRGAGDE